MALIVIATPKGINSNSYITRTEGDTYHEGRLYSDPWTNASDTKKDQAIVMATRLLDQNFDWMGYPTLADVQALAWPRYGTWDRDGVPYNHDLIPQPIVEATAELARILLTKDREAETGTEGLRRLKVDTIDIEFDKVDRPGPIPDSVLSIVAHLGELIVVSANSGITAARLVRC